ncbi:MAG TPA: tRNA guanosine(34) transglycosylase Tgt [Solirubrobacteraceae bacterium]|jgi:queuine tRNA-ribosyltransferase|nr:tRNA guanosine(34) transglycosylase Tgt [Solirubrobacteraceae bacterium]
MFEIRTRASDSRARTGTLRLAHGDVQTPAFVPLATRGAVKTLEPRDVEALGYEMVLGNTFHLYLSPGPELIDDFGGLGAFMRWPRPIITDSGGFQVFSMGHGSVADEIKGRGRGGNSNTSNGAILEIGEGGVRFRSYIDGSERFMAPETSMAVQAALHSDIALVLDECTPFHVTRDYTARSTERTHRWLERCLDWHDEHGPRDQVVYGIVQGGVEYDLRTESAEAVARSRCGGIAIGGSLGQDKPQMHEVVGWTTAALERVAADRPRHLLGIGDIDDLLIGVSLGIDTFDCAMPTRLARHGVAIVPDPDARWRVDLAKSKFRHSQEPIMEGCPCPACSAGFTRGYINYAARAGETTGPRLLTLHNLSYIQRLMADLRDAIDAGRLADAVAGFMAGAAPSAH